MKTMVQWFRRGSAAVAMGLLAGCASDNASKFEPAPTSYFTATVRQGEPLSAIASRYQVREDDLLALNGVYDRRAVTKGTSLRIPAYGQILDPEPAPETRVASANDDAPPASKQSLRRSQVEKTSIPAPKSAAQKASPESSWWSWFAPPADTPQPDERFLWPVKGTVLSRFGASADGARNDGINISASRGAPVHAAAEGTVTYVGDDLKAYGNLILIRHDNGFITAYAHCDKIAVKRGEHVMSGQVIADVGATGDVDRPQVHFELRHGTTPVDPAPYLVASN